MSKNNSIKCDIRQCKYNYRTEEYCTLGQIQIGTHEKNSTLVECIDYK